MNEIHGLNSAIVHYGSSLHKREENFDNVSFESSTPTVVHHWQGSQDSNNVETKDKPSNVLRDTDAHTRERTEFGLQFLDARRAENITSKHSSPSVSQIWFDTVINV